jgi:hypothetical protein
MDVSRLLLAIQDALTGKTTGRVARTFRISAARVSQLRRELCANWHRFMGELTDVNAPSLVTA